MRYGREVTVGSETRLTEVVEIPSSGQGDPTTWLATFLPHLSAEGWIHVADDNVSGAVKNGSVYDNPSVTVPVVPRTLTRLQFVRLCQSAGGMTDENLVAAKANADLAALWIKLDLAEDVSRDDPDTVSGLAALEALEYLPEGASAVTAGWPTA